MQQYLFCFIKKLIEAVHKGKLINHTYMAIFPKRQVEV